MASRKKPDPAALRTIGIFTGKTPIEEAEALVREEAGNERQAGPRDVVAEAEDCAIRWLGLDVFHHGDDVRVAVHPEGHAVLLLVSTGGRLGAPYGTTTIKMSRAQWAKLKRLARESR